MRQAIGTSIPLQVVARSTYSEYNQHVKIRSLSLLILATLIFSACIPPIPPTRTPTYTATSPVSTETLTPSGTSTDTPSSTSTDTVTATNTETDTPTLTLSPTSTETSTSTSTLSATSTGTSISTLTPTLTPSPSALRIPTLNDWQAGSLAFSHGAEGEWDFYLWGGFANSLIKKNNTYYLYYQGSPSYNDQCDSVAHRAIGVATSTDGIHWTKSDQNPILTWSSQGSIEEGAVSSAAWLGADGKIYLYYGANTGSGCSVNANARLAVSEDGVNFQDLGQVLSGTDPHVWGSGDEIFPIGTYSYANQWYLYYTPNGVPLARKLGVASGSSSTTFTQTMGVNHGTIPAWGPVSVILGGPDSVLIANPNDGSGSIHFYRFRADNPSVVQLHDSYAIPNCTQPSVLYEGSGQRWLMACRDQNADTYLIRQAFTP